MKSLKVLSFVAVATFAGASLLTYQSCGKFKSLSSVNEDQLLLASNPFTYNYGINTHAKVDNVYSDYDAIPHNPYLIANDSLNSTIADCSDPARYNLERELAVADAIRDSSGLTVPVQFAFSFGSKLDDIARYAHMRAVLSADNPGFSYIPVGPKNASTYGGKHFYYTANHDNAKQQFLSGQKCFFSTIKIVAGSGKSSTSYYDFIKNATHIHEINYMYYGWYSGNVGKDGGNYVGDYANRLFTETPSLNGDGTPQIIKLYMADLREAQIGNDSILKVEENTTRGLEINKSTQEILDVCNLHYNLDQVADNLSRSVSGEGGTFAPVVGANQLLEDLVVSDFGGTILATQYTPIVVDLGVKGIRTSSVRWGTYFNMAALRNKSLTDSDPLKMWVPHRTAWLGGIYKDDGSGTDSAIDLVNEDGFLVVPDANGKVISSMQMFGDNMQVNGKFYANGFLALRAFADKNCLSNEIKDQYLGPWDKELYSSKIQVWVDKNRNGAVDAEELKTLEQHGIAAINTCNVVHSEKLDKFGNGTSLRAAFLMEKEGENLINNESEIVNRIKTGKTSAGEEAEFRLTIDIIFKVNESLLCKNMTTEKLQKPKGDTAFVSSAVQKKK